MKMKASPDSSVHAEVQRRILLALRALQQPVTCSRQKEQHEGGGVGQIGGGVAASGVNQGNILE